MSRLRFAANLRAQGFHVRAYRTRTHGSHAFAPQYPVEVWGIVLGVGDRDGHNYRFHRAECVQKCRVVDSKKNNFQKDTFEAGEIAPGSTLSFLSFVGIIVRYGKIGWISRVA
jgi:hypothetical protein